MKAEKLKSERALLVLEMIFSLLVIPCGLAFVKSFFTEPVEINWLLLPASFLCLALAEFFRAAGRRYKKEPIAVRVRLGYVFSAAYLSCAVILYFNQASVTVAMIAGVVFMLSFVPGRVLSILRDRRWYWVVINVLSILLLLYLAIEVWYEGEEEQAYGALFLIAVISASAFLRIMSAIFSSIRLDLLRDVVRKTYATEIIFGLLLLIFSFSWVLVYIDSSFSTFGDALWYCFAVVTTIGFGDLTAATFVGRVLSVILGIYGIIVVALITSIIVNFYGEMKKGE